jgi:hypothetical protein
MIDCLGYNLSLSMAFFVIMSLFISPIFVPLCVVYYLTLYFIWGSNRKDLEQIKDVDSFLKMKFNSVLEDMIQGINNIRAGGFNKYFEVRINIFLEKMI